MLGLGLNLLIGGWSPKAWVSSPVHALFPGAILKAVAGSPTLTGGLKVNRHYQALASFREVAEWYQGKDSLMPLPAAMGSGCFQQSFQRRLLLIPGFIRGSITEEVTICPTTAGVAIISITTTQFRVFGLRGLP